jgi:hypothetical protein
MPETMAIDEAHRALAKRHFALSLPFSPYIPLTARGVKSRLFSMIKAFAYLRVSSKGQVGGDGFTRQLAAIRQYATAHDIKILREQRIWRTGRRCSN